LIFIGLDSLNKLFFSHSKLFAVAILMWFTAPLMSALNILNTFVSKNNPLLQQLYYSNLKVKTLCQAKIYAIKMVSTDFDRYLIS